MEQQQQRGRGRARGRARGPQTGGPAPKPGPQPGAPPQGAWGGAGAAAVGGPPPAVAPQQAPPAWGPRTQVQQQHQIRAPAPQQQPQAGGRATYRTGGDGRTPGTEAEVTGQVGGGAEGGFLHSGRGAIRGRRPLTDLATYYRTKPQDMQSKQG